MTAPADLLAEADALEAQVAAWFATNPGVMGDAGFAYLNRALPLIRALRERWKKADEFRELELHFKQQAVLACEQMQARLESLEAERDEWKTRARFSFDWPNPTPSEIAARVAEKRKVTGG